MLVLRDLARKSTEDLLRSVSLEVSAQEDEAFALGLASAAREARKAARNWDFRVPARIVDEFITAPSPRAAAESDDRSRLRRVAVARLALDHFRVTVPLPDDILSLFPDFLQRLGGFLSGKGRAYDDEFFAKDVRYALGVTLPGGALQFDLGRIGPRLIARHAIASGSLETAHRYVRAFGWRRWYYEHMDSRAARQFNPDGWTDHCLRMARVLTLNADVAGIVGAGWFYDPALATVSPSLAYIHQTQIRHGAFLLRLSTEQRHVENALYRSAARRRAYSEGRYIPACYMCAWPRKSLLSWAEQVKRDPCASFGAFAMTESGTVTGPAAAAAAPVTGLALAPSERAA